MRKVLRIGACVSSIFLIAMIVIIGGLVLENISTSVNGETSGTIKIRVGEVYRTSLKFGISYYAVGYMYSGKASSYVYDQGVITVTYFPGFSAPIYIHRGQEVVIGKWLYVVREVTYEYVLLELVEGS